MSTAPSLPELRASIDATMGALPLADGTIAEAIDAGGVPAVRCAPVGGASERAVLYFHGGGYRMGSAVAWRSFGSHLAWACDAVVVVVDYRLAPEHPYPAAIDDALTAYRWLIERTPPRRVVVAGDSAGGGLAAALVLAARDAELAPPAGVVCCSPWADLTNTAASFTSRAEADTMFSQAAADMAAARYLAGTPADTPTASPVFGDWTGAPPLLVQVGDAEVLLDDAARLAAVAAASGADVEHHVFAGMPHVFQLSYPSSPESVEAVEQIAAFIDRVTGDRPPAS